VTKRFETLVRRAEGALGRAFRQLDAAGEIAKKLDAGTMKWDSDGNFVELMIIREVIERVGRICNAAFIADARAAGPLPFPPRDRSAGMAPGAWVPPANVEARKARAPRAAGKKKRR